MDAAICEHALDRVPLTIIFDDSTVLVNLNYFFIQDFERAFGERRRWEDLPVVHPESFTREFAEFCLREGVKGKFSIVPCPAGLGRIDEGLPLFGKRQQDSWLEMCRQLITPNFDITPEMLTHTFVADLETLRPVDDVLWEQRGWHRLPVNREEWVTDYIARSCEILSNVGLPPEGVTSPGGFGEPVEFYARCAGNAVRRVTGNPIPYIVKYKREAQTPVWFAERNSGSATVQIVARTSGDYMGSWTGYGEVDPGRYVSSDLQGGELPPLIDAGEAAVIIGHWQGMYGLHDQDRRGFNTLKTVVRRLRERDPQGERTRWRKCSEIAGYLAARHLAEITVDGTRLSLDLPVRVPELTLRVTGSIVRQVHVDGFPLVPVTSRARFESGTFLRDEGSTLLAFNPKQRAVTIDIAA